MAKTNQAQSCPCGSGKDFAQCCARYISGQESAPSAESLMRSRYTAYTLENQEYLQKTWHPRSRPELRFDQQEKCKWMGLTVLGFEQQGEQATVEFIARYKVQGRAQRLHEISRFEYQDGQWFYVDGIFQE